MTKKESFKEATAGLPDYEAANWAERNAKTFDYIYTFRKNGVYIFHDEYTM